MKFKIATLALIATVIMGCKSDKTTENEASQGDTVDITNTQWTLVTLEGNDLESAEQNGQIIHFTLHSEGNNVSGYAGCNRFTGKYSLDGDNRITFSALGTTRMACPNSTIDERNVLSVLEMTDNYTVDGDQLMLNKAKSAPLAVFSKSELDSKPITQIKWRLKSFEGKEIAKAENEEEDIYFMLNAVENRVEGFAGCNTISGSYTLNRGNKISFNGVAVTLKACPDMTFNEAEFLKVFEMADNYTINGDELNLNVGRRAPLAVFEAVK